jgi:uncharacterized protein YuzE
MNKRVLNGLGEWDYDYSNDILFFKVKERAYSYSIELKNLVMDIDEENFVVGLQIFDASRFFNLPKEVIREIKNWKLEVNIEENIAEVRLIFESLYRNKLIEKNPILIQQINREIPNSQLVCNA